MPLRSWSWCVVNFHVLSPDGNDRCAVWSTVVAGEQINRKYIISKRNVRIVFRWDLLLFILLISFSLDIFRPQYGILSEIGRRGVTTAA